MRGISTLLLLCGLLLTACSDKERFVAFGNDRVYYVSPVDKATAEKVGHFLQEYRYFIDQGAVVQLVNDTSFVARFATRAGIEKDPYIIDGFVTLQLEMSLSVFDGNRVDLQLCDSTLTTKGTITFNDAKAWLEGRAYVEN